MSHAQSVSRAPAMIRRSGPITSRLLRFGLPMGPNRVLTIRGRVSGRPLNVPLAVLEEGDRRWVIGTFGETNWVRNLRANPDVELRYGSRTEPVRAVELGRAEAEAFFRDTLASFIGHFPRLWRTFGRLFLRFAAPEMITDPALAAIRRPVFELVTR
jgi:deazaflavin-dependent oxidoreductase (nitroreductase family)